MSDNTLYMGCRENVYCAVTVAPPGTAIDTDTDTAEVAILASGIAPADTDWVDATWTASGERDYVTVLVAGADEADQSADITLDAGEYIMWVRITQGNELTIVKAGYLIVAAS